MSHTAHIKTKLTDPKAIEKACQRIGAEFTQQAKTKLYDGRTAQGISVKLKGWLYPITFNAEGGATFDNYRGAWGKEEEFSKLKQAYAIEKVRIEAEAKGYAIQETQQENGSVQLELCTYS
jgi:ABC-type uncharacterized transport system YnjBCD substrate-binding protein